MMLENTLRRRLRLGVRRIPNLLSHVRVGSHMLNIFSVGRPALIFMMCALVGADIMGIQGYIGIIVTG